MNRPQLTSLHYTTVTSSIVETKPLLFFVLKKKWNSFTKYQQTSFLLNASALFGILAFVCYLFFKPNSRKINRKKSI